MVSQGGNELKYSENQSESSQTITKLDWARYT